MKDAREEKGERLAAVADLSARLLTVDGELKTVRLINLSQNGCRIADLIEEFEVGAPVGVELPGLTEFTIGTVAWFDNHEAGIAFEKPLFEPVYRYLRDKLFGLDEAA